MGPLLFRDLLIINEKQAKDTMPGLIHDEWIVMNLYERRMQFVKGGRYTGKQEHMSPCLLVYIFTFPPCKLHQRGVG